MAELSESEKLTLIESFRKKAQTWWQDMQNLENTLVPKDSPYYSQKMDLLKKAYLIRAKIESIPGLSKTFENTLNGWPIAVAVVGGGVIVWALAAFKSTSNEATKIKLENQKYNDLIKSGYSPAKASEASKSPVKYEWSDVAYKSLQLLPWIGAFYVGYKIAKMTRLIK